MAEAFGRIHGGEKVEAFSAGSKYSQVKISPTGEYLSFTSEVEGRDSLVVVELSTNWKRFSI